MSLEDVDKILYNFKSKKAHLTLDSRKLKKGDIFLAINGSKFDGRNYIQDALDNGASVVLAQNPIDNSKYKFNKDVYLIEVDDLDIIKGAIASKYYEYPANNLHVIGITGTNGKTSISQFISQVLSSNSEKCGIIGTLGVGFLNQIEHTGLTTPDSVYIHKTFRNFLDNGASSVAMEVSSHALEQNRVQDVNFDSCIFTNLSKEHLDYHKDMEEYWNAKRKLFFDFEPKSSIVNVDDGYGLRLSFELEKANREYIGYSINKHPRAQIIAFDYKLEKDRIYTKIKSPWGMGECSIPLLGEFNLSNILAVVGASCLKGVSFDSVLEAIENLVPIPGRMLPYGGGDKPLVVVDYAHTPDALHQALFTLKSHCIGKLWCVVGCGGDRDKGKRPIMASIAKRISDKLVLTSDNPRTEEQSKIFEDMLKAIKDPNSIMVEGDRAKAIEHCILNANSNDIILVAGKGHENYQIIGDDTIYFSDSDEVLKSLSKRS